MHILIENCFHWAGFHLINQFLEEGILVKGVDQVNTPKKEHLSMYVSRNDSFTLYDIKPDEKDWHCAIKVGDCSVGELQEQSITLSILSGVHKANECIIRIPHLIGEWMPYEQMVSLKNDEVKLQSAISIKDLTHAIHQWIDIETLLPATINVVSARKKDISTISSVELESLVYLRDNRSILTCFEEIMDHYQKFQVFY